MTSLTDIDGINQWDVLVDNLKGAPRNMLVHMDEVRGESAIISNGTFKLVKGKINNRDCNNSPFNLTLNFSK